MMSVSSSIHRHPRKCRRSMAIFANRTGATMKITTNRGMKIGMSSAHTTPGGRT
jgi:hypothetical protein